jgi:DNA polymerase-3 subunit epsilon/CBS domain-containing protein
MELRRNASALAALDAIVLDTETTGLDPRKAQVVEIGAVRISRGAPNVGPVFRQLVRPASRIPAAATQIHGIDDRTVMDASVFADVWPELSAYLDVPVLIGHMIGFDIAVLSQECKRIGTEFRVAAVLDVRILAEVAQPGLAGYTLEHLASWLDTSISGRHSALGDARAAAEIFCALVPRLRKQGIRTLGEALRACEEASGHPAAAAPHAWQTPLKASAKEAAATAAEPAARLDIDPYRRRVSALMTAPARWIAGNALVSDALENMIREKISSLFVAGQERGEPLRAAECGIVTERDILRALAEHGAAGLALPVGQIATKPLLTIATNEYVYRAIARMNRFRIRHLAVTDDADRLAGALSARDLLRLRGERAAELGDEIGQAADTASLASAWAGLPPAAAALLDEGLSAREAAAVISNEVGALTGRAVMLAERALESSGQGKPPASYAFVVLGSAGRHESLLAMDQDNALVFEDGAPHGADRWFAALGEKAAAILDEAGVPYCPGGVMAKNAAWRGSLSAWRSRIGVWMERSNPHDLLSVDIFFDIRGVHGDIELADELRRYAFDMARGRPEFCKLLIEAGGHIQRGRTWWGGFHTQEGRIDLKKAGLFGIVSAARALAIRHHVTAPSTPERLSGLKALHIGAENDLDSLINAQGVFLDLILKQQLEDIRAGIRPGNTVDVRRLSLRERNELRAALAAGEQLETLTRDLLF